MCARVVPAAVEQVQILAPASSQRFHSLHTSLVCWQLAASGDHQTGCATTDNVIMFTHKTRTISRSLAEAPLSNVAQQKIAVRLKMGKAKMQKRN